MRARSRVLMVAICALAIGLMTAPARADVIYTFSATSFITGQTVGFQYTTPSYLTSATTLNWSQLTPCASCSSAPLLAVLAPSGLLGPSISFTGLTGSGAYWFPVGAFGGGTYSVIGLVGNATLIVTSVAEPGTIMFAFLSLAMVLGFVVLRRSRRLQMNHS